jgi:nicotinate-nucleotide pyrophosphorylase (carboxylating)
MNPSSSLPNDLSSHVEYALREDIGTGDISAQLIAQDTIAKATIYCRENAIVCGLPWALEVFKKVDPSLQIEVLVNEGQQASQDQALLNISGNARALLTAERCALNYLQTLSGTATLARRYADRVAHTKVQLLDTRKTIPGLRSAQKYAVRIGGCHNHRMGLFDAFLIKENHINACGSIASAITNARSLHPEKTVEIEVENLQQLDEALRADADIIMLDNFVLEDLVLAVRINQGRAKLEASGGINHETLVPIAQTGVDFISIGALTKDCKAIDLSMLFH